jgi:hypothetical protein
MVIYYNKNEGLELQADEILNSINKEIDTQKVQLDNVLKCLEDVNDLVQTTDQVENARELTSLLMNLKENFAYLRENIADLKKLREMMNTIRIENIGKDVTKVKKFAQEVDQFNETATRCNKHILEDNVKVNNFYAEYVKNSDFIYNPSATVKEQEENAAKIHKLAEILQSDNTKTEDLQDNKTLLISAKKGIVELPYTVAELKIRKAKNKEYQTLQDVIKAEYIIPMNRYKNASIARFREGYNLMRKREKKGVVASLDLALELAFKSLLNPAIITACKSLDELDIYLDCLQSNELDKFKIFEIKYEVAPHKQTIFDE